jgi:hypothetical protein
MSFVLDNSVAMLWLLPQSNPSGCELADKVLAQLQETGARVPSLYFVLGTELTSYRVAWKTLMSSCMQWLTDCLCTMNTQNVRACIADCVKMQF